jgi:hypothetical protein
MERCAEVMLEEIRAHLNSETTIKQLEIVLFDPAALAIFEQTFVTLGDDD